MIFCFVIGLENSKNHWVTWQVYLPIISWDVKIGKHTDRKTLLCIVCCLMGKYNIVPMHTIKTYGGVRTRNVEGNRDNRCQKAANVKTLIRRAEGSQGLEYKKKGGQKTWVIAFKS